MIFLSEDVIILRELFSKSKSPIYYFHEKYLFSPGQLARSINKLFREKIIYLNDDEILITDYGIKWTIANRKKIFLEQKKLFWKQVPDFMKGDQVLINELYKPKRKLLDFNFFAYLIDKQNGQA